MSSAIGQLIREFRLDLVVGSGALGTTFRAQHVRTSEIVAVKLLHQGICADVNFAERFRSTVAEAAALTHRNVLRIRDSGAQTGQFFIVMDFVATGSLRSQLTSKLQLRRALDLARQCADGLAAGHALGVLHRDVKPENVLIEEARGTDTVKLADFGLTRLAESGLTIDGALAVGSLPYMSPEQLRGLTLDARSDVYSLGVVLYEMVTGLPPFQVRNQAEALARHTLAQPPSPGSMVANLGSTVEGLILRALEKDPAKRFQTAKELSAALEEEIDRLPAKPLVVWHGPAVAPATRRIEARSRHGGGVARRRFPLTPSEDSPAVAVAPGHQEGGEGTLPPGIEQANEGERKSRARPGEDSRRIRVVLERETMTLVPGQQAVFTVTIMNSGRTVDHFTLSVRGVDESWVTTPVRPQQLNPGQRAVVPLSVFVPRVSASRAGTYPVRVVARSRENPDEEGTAPASWIVQPYADTLLTLFPPKARGWRRGRFKSTVRNQGNSAARHSLTGEDDEKMLDFRFDTREFDLEAGEEREVPLTTTAKRRIIGSPDVRTFRVTAKSAVVGGASEPPKSAGGQFVHRAFIPIWLPPLLVLAGIGAFMIRARMIANARLSIAVVPPAVQLSIGSSSPLEATVKDGKNEVVSGRPISWTSRNALIASVSETGVVTGLSEGATVVTASVEKASHAVQVSVVPAIVEKVSLSPRKVTIRIGSSAQLQPTITDGNGNPLRRDPLWQSSDPTVATVGGGRVTAKAPGSATITMQVESKMATADVTVPDTAGSGAKVAIGKEDCEAYNPESLTLTRDRVTGWHVTDGQTVVATLDREDEARQVQALGKRYRKHCFIGRANTRTNQSEYRIEYWSEPTNLPSPIKKEECFAYDRGSLTTKNIGASGFSLEDRSRRLLLADNASDAKRVYDIAKNYQALCTIGSRNKRPNRRDYVVQYWR